MTVLRRATEGVHGASFSIQRAEAALRNVCSFDYLAGGLRLFGAGDFWQPGEEKYIVCRSTALSL